jgi:ribosomal protein S18 acetylase RimI-like enzyme
MSPATLAASASPALAAAGVSLRLARPGDEPFLRALFRELRWDEFAPLGWPDAERTRFIDTQFDFQRLGYQTAFPAAECYLVEHAGVPIGKFEIDRPPGRMAHVVDIALVAASRGRGIGEALLRLLQDDAPQGVCLEVEHGNPARRLYARLGFVDVPPEDDLPRLSREMVWRA